MHIIWNNVGQKSIKFSFYEKDYIKKSYFNLVSIFIWKWILIYKPFCFWRIQFAVDM